MSTVSNVTAGVPKVGGAIFVAPVGTKLPTTATETLNAAFVQTGYVSEDGLTNSNSPETETIKAWGGDTVLVNQTSKEDTFQFTMLEALSADVLKLMYGDSNVTGDLSKGITVSATTEQLEAKSYVIDMVMRNNVLKRIVIPQGDITAAEDITYKSNEAVGYGVTISAMPDANGVTHYEYIQSPTTSSSN